MFFKTQLTAISEKINCFYSGKTCGTRPRDLGRTIHIVVPTTTTMSKKRKKNIQKRGYTGADNDRRASFGGEESIGQSLAHEHLRLASEWQEKRSSFLKKAIKKRISGQHYKDFLQNAKKAFGKKRKLLLPPDPDCREEGYSIKLSVKRK